MIEKQADGVSWLEFELFQNYPEIQHGIFLKNEGVFYGPKKTLSFGLAEKDLPENLKKNLEIASKAVQLPRFYTANQVHGVKCISDFKEEGELDGDLLFTKEKRKPLLVRHADCQAALVYDPVKKAVAAVHAGWRGMVKDIYQEMVLFFQNNFGSRPQDLLVAIAPSLGPMASEFKHYKEEFPPHFHSFQVKPLYFDLWEIAAFQLKKAGILEKNMQIARICTYQNPELFFSFRRKDPRGHNNGSFITLK